jgi:hypothetical protein
VAVLYTSVTNTRVTKTSGNDDMEAHARWIALVEKFADAKMSIMRSRQVSTRYSMTMICATPRVLADHAQLAPVVAQTHPDGEVLTVDVMLTLSQWTRKERRNDRTYVAQIVEVVQTVE